MPHKKDYVGKKKSAEMKEAKQRELHQEQWRQYCSAEIHRLYGVPVDPDSITCMHCALSVIEDEGYTSDNEMARIRVGGRLKAPLSFEPTPRPDVEL